MPSHTLRLPDSITTWEIQVITLSAAKGQDNSRFQTCLDKNKNKAAFLIAIYCHVSFLQVSVLLSPMSFKYLRICLYL